MHHFLLSRWDKQWTPYLFTLIFKLEKRKRMEHFVSHFTTKYPSQPSEGKHRSMVWKWFFFFSRLVGYPPQIVTSPPLTDTRIGCDLQERAGWERKPQPGQHDTIQSKNLYTNKNIFVTQKHGNEWPREHARNCCDAQAVFDLYIVTK